MAARRPKSRQRSATTDTSRKGSPRRTGCIRLLPALEPVGGIGYWERAWQGETVYEAGWGVQPEFQGRGIATDAVLAAVASARAEHRNRRLHALPCIGNPASNAVGRKSGFLFVMECDFEYPKGPFIRCNDWRVDLW